jgi:hypothetical protein
MRTTHTYALLPVSQAAYDEIREKLMAAGYDDYVQRGVADEQERVIMQGIALVVDTKGLTGKGPSSKSA